MADIVQRISGKVVIANPAGDILLLRESATHATNTQGGRYMLPGGRIEIGERFFDGLAREVDEETGLHVTVGQPLMVGEWQPVIQGVETQIICLFFAAAAQSSDVRLSEEHDDYIWIKPEDYKKYTMATPEDDVVALYLDLKRKGQL